MMAIAFSVMLNHAIAAVDLGVKCTVYEHSDDINGNNVDVRILALNLKENSLYTAEVTPDHNAPVSVTAKTDYDGILWVIVKIPNGEKSTLFDVKVYKGTDKGRSPVISGSDDSPCYGIPYISGLTVNASIVTN